jgi:hypothetical protein
MIVEEPGPSTYNIFESLTFFFNINDWLWHLSDNETYLTWYRKNKLAITPNTTTVYEIYEYETSPFLKTFNTKRPMPKTVKLAIKVKVFLTLLSRSYLYINVNTRLFREHVKEGTKLIWLIWTAAHPILKSDANVR